MHRLNSAPYIKPGSQTYRNGKETITGTPGERPPLVINQKWSDKSDGLWRVVRLHGKTKNWVFEVVLEEEWFLRRAVFCQVAIVLQRIPCLSH